MGPLPTPGVQTPGLRPEGDGVGVKASRELQSHSHHKPVQHPSHVLQHLILSTGFNGGREKDAGYLMP